MEFHYRGVSYNHNPAVVDTIVGEVVGKYRGSAWRVHQLKQTPAVKPHPHLTYRGVSYN